MKKILYIHNQSVQSVSSGSLNVTLLQVFSMCEAFQSIGYSVTLAIDGGYKSNEAELRQFISKSFKQNISFKIKCWQRKNKNNFANRVLLKNTIINLAKEVSPDFIITREPFFLTSLGKLSFKLIFESHNNKLYNKISLVNRILKNHLLKCVKRENFTCFLSISESLHHFWIKNGVQPEKSFFWHDGFDSDLFVRQRNKVEARLKLGLPLDKKIVAYTGGLYPNREIENIIETAHFFPEILFLIVGGPEKNKIYYQDLTNQKNVKNVSYTGFVEHKAIPEYLYAADVLLALWSLKVPTILYCSPLKLFEYMAAGRVILAHDFPTIREVLDGDNNVFFCDPHRNSSVREQLEMALMKSSDEESGYSLRLKAFALYTWDIRAKKIKGFIEANKKV